MLKTETETSKVILLVCTWKILKPRGRDIPEMKDKSRSKRERAALALSIMLYYNAAAAAVVVVIITDCSAKKAKWWWKSEWWGYINKAKKVGQLTQVQLLAYEED